MSRRNWRGARPCPDWKRRPRESGTHKGSFMDIRAPEQQYNPYRIFSREQWARLRDDTPMTLEPGEFERLRSMHDRLDLQEVEKFYLPLSRWFPTYVEACSASIRRSANSSASGIAKCPTSSASQAPSQLANRPPRACCRRCWRDGRRGPRSIW